MIARLLASATGVWLTAAPALIEHSAPATDNNRAVGPIIASLAFVALWPLGRWLRWAMLPLGVWLVIAPLFIIYGNSLAVLNTLTAGLLICTGALADGTARQSLDGG